MSTRPAARLVARAAILLFVAGAALPSQAQDKAKPAPANAPKPAATSAPAPASTGQPAQPNPAAQAKELQRQRVALLNDWIHYTRIHKFEMARSSGQALIDTGITDTELVALVEDVAKVGDAFNDVVTKSQRHAEGEEIASRLLKSYDAGKLAHARDAAEIARNIAMLNGTMREKDYAFTRLVSAGEYATPQLLQALLDRSNLALQAQVRTVLVRLGQQAVIPLTTALFGLDPSNQEVVVGVLGDIAYPSSVPFLYELRETTKSNAVRAACDRAIHKRAGVVTDEMPVAERFLNLANEYYQENRSLTSFPNEQVQLLWNFNPGSGLFATPIDTLVFHEAMCMQLCERTLRHDPQNGEALSLWIAANFSREIDTPEGYANPVYGKDRREAMYYAVAAGAPADQRVLGRGLDARDTPLARRAIAAIEKTAGGRALWSGAGSRRPLLEAISYPNRRVQYEAALALGAAQPRETFNGSARVVPILGSAIRNASARYALVVAPTGEVANSHAQTLRAKGYTVLPPARQLADVEQAIAEAPGLDIVVSDLPAAQTEKLIDEVRGRPNLRAVPVLALVSTAAYSDLGAKYAGDAAIRIAREGLSPEQVGAASDQLIEAAVGGPVSAEEAIAYKVRALKVLRDLAVAGNTVLNVADASNALVAALPESTTDLRLQIAEVMSYIPSKNVQVALMDAALAASGPEQIELLGKMSDSAKRNGNMLEQRQVSALVQLAKGGGSDDQATAAAALMGALNLPNAELIPLIAGKQ